MSESSANADICPDCGRALPSLSGLCAACLWAGLDSAEGGLALPGLEISGEIARGGMGVVYRAKERGAGREVAVKMMLTSLADTPGARERFAQEARAVGAMDHPGILPVYHVGEQGGLPYFTMKLASGGTLAARRARLSGRWREIAGLLAEIADAVDHAHKHGLLHRDLKPANILFDADGRSYVSDFGLVKIAGDDGGITRTVAMLGTPSYLAPEVAARDARAASVASDVWSLGAMLYELLAGRLPFEADGIPSLLRKIVEDDPEAISEAPRDLATIARKCLRKNPVERYTSAAELANDLRAWLDGRTISARRATVAERLRSWSRRNPALAASLAVLVLAAAAVIVLQARAGRELRREKKSAVAAQVDALVAQVAAARIAGRIDQRDAALAAARQIAPLRAGDALRDDAISLLATPGWKELGSAEIDVESQLLFSANLEWAAAILDGGLTIIRTADGSVEKHVPPEGVVLRGVVTLSPAGQRATAWDGSGTFYDFDRNLRRWTVRLKHEKHASVLIWNTANGRYAAFDTASQRTTIFDGAYAIPVGTETARPLAFSPDGNLLAVADGNAALIFNAVSGEMVHRLELPPKGSQQLTLKWRSDSRAFAVSSGRMDVSIAYLDGDAPIVETLAGYGVVDVAWHPSGEWIAASNADGTLRIWETIGRREILRTPLMAGQVEFSENGSTLAVREQFSKRLLRYGFEAPTCVRQRLLPRKAALADGKETPTPPWSCWLSDDGALGLATGQLALEWIDTSAMRIAASGPSGAYWKVGAIKGGLFALGLRSGKSPSFSKYRIEHSAGEFVLGKQSQGTGTVFGFANSADGRILSLESGSGIVCATLGGAYIHRSTLAPAPPLTGTVFPGPSLMSPDGRWLVVSSGAANAVDWIAIWDTTAPEQPPRKMSGLSVGCGFAFSPDSRTLFLHSERGLTAFVTGSWEQKWNIPRSGRSFSICLLAISGDGRLLAAAAAPNGIALHDSATGRRFALLRHPDLRPYGALALSHDGGTLLATGIPSSVQVWRLGEVHRQLLDIGIEWNAPDFSAVAPAGSVKMNLPDGL